MLIQFTVENFLSIRDKVYLSLEPSKDSEHPENLITKGDYNAVTSAAIYGANASGKSSLFKAITIALIMLRNSNNIQVTDRLPVVPFKFDSESKNKPTSFEFTFVASDDKKYIYGFSATAEKVVEEYLYCYNSAKPTLIFDIKDGEEPKYNRAYKVKLEAAYQMNTPNKLFLATATTWNAECTKIPFEWLAEYIDTFTEVMDLSGVAIEKLQGNILSEKGKVFNEDVRSFLKTIPYYLVADYDVSIKKNGNLTADQDYGDIDVFVYDKKHNCVFNKMRRHACRACKAGG